MNFMQIYIQSFQKRISINIGGMGVLMKDYKKNKNDIAFAVTAFVIIMVLCILAIIMIMLRLQFISIIAISLILIIAALIFGMQLKTIAKKDAAESLIGTDALTGIRNRRFFMEYAATQIERSNRINRNCHIIMFDIDNFKQINDRYGHAAGDEVLKLISNRVKKEIRPYDLFARYGGEEFILLVCDAEDKTVVSLANRLREGIENETLLYNKHEISTTASFGIAKYSSEYTIEEVINFADKALYCSKNSGRNTVNFYFYDI